MIESREYAEKSRLCENPTTRGGVCCWPRVGVAPCTPVAAAHEKPKMCIMMHLADLLRRSYFLSLFLSVRS